MARASGGAGGRRVTENGIKSNGSDWSFAYRIGYCLVQRLAPAGAAGEAGIGEGQDARAEQNLQHGLPERLKAVT